MGMSTRYQQYKEYFDWSTVKPGMAFLHDSTLDTRNAIFFVTIYDGDYIFEYRKFENCGMSQKFGIYRCAGDELHRIPEKDKNV